MTLENRRLLHDKKTLFVNCSFSNRMPSLRNNFSLKLKTIKMTMRLTGVRSQITYDRSRRTSKLRKLYSTPDVSSSPDVIK